MSVTNQAIARISVPLPFRPSAVNAYRVPLAGGGWMLVDGGVDTDEAWVALDRGVEEAGGWDGLRLHLVTHMHVDHFGLARRVGERTGVERAMGVLDAERSGHAAADAADEAAYREQLLRRAGAPGGITRTVSELSAAGAALAPFVSIDHHLPTVEAALPQAPEWRSIWAPGHTAGHIVLFRESDRTLIAGDVVLTTISPTIGVNRQRPDPVSDYVATLKNLMRLEPRVILGGHGEAMQGPQRIQELLDEALAESVRVRLLAERGRTAWEIAELRYEGRDLPLAMKVQALRETLAHLSRLCDLGEVRTEEGEGEALRYFQ